VPKWCQNGAIVAPVQQPPSPADVCNVCGTRLHTTADHVEMDAAREIAIAWEPTMVTREGMLEERVGQLEGEVAFLREVVRALVERRGPVRIG